MEIVPVAQSLDPSFSSNRYPGESRYRMHTTFPFALHEVRGEGGAKRRMRGVYPHVDCINKR
jgi:hypothetical protein